MSFINKYKVTLLISVLCFIAAALINSGCSSSMPPEQVVLAYLDAMNSHDIDSLMTLYADSIVFDIPDLSMYYVGRNALRGIAGYDSVLNTAMELTITSVKGDTVRCTIRETNGWLDAAGLTAAYYPESYFVVKNNKIRHIYADLADSCADNFYAVIGSFMPWAQENRPDLINSVMANGRFVFNAASGVRIVALLKEWRQATGE